MNNKLCLGTVQLGIKYGIKNEIGRQPTNEESFNVLKMAIDSGVKYFDTASVYGNAEKLLGEFKIANYPVKVISKMSPYIVNSVSGVLQELEKSLHLLKLEVLDGYLLHNAADIYNPVIIEGLLKAKALGKIRNIGVSIYEPKDALTAIKSDWVDYIQIPYNVFDQRLNQTDFFDYAAKRRIKVFARSSFLQGLLLMEENAVPRHLIRARPYLEKFNRIIERYGYSRLEAAFLFSYCNRQIDKVVFGVDTQLQLKINLEIIKKAESFSSCYHALYGSFQDIELEIITPSLWGK